jgi:hypothetical protein
MGGGEVKGQVLHVTVEDDGVRHRLQEHIVRHVALFVLTTDR